MREGSGMVEFEKRFPDRYHDVGIAEQHAVTFAAGLACEGSSRWWPLLNLLQRAYDQLIHDVAIQNLRCSCAGPCWHCGRRRGHHAGAYDIAFLRCIPNMNVLTPPMKMNAGNC